MVDYVASQTISLDDQLSAGAAAATAALGKLADAADAASASTDTVTDRVTKAGASAAALATRFDPATKAANDLAKAQAALASGQATMAVAVDAGTKTQAQADAVTASLTARVRAAQAAVDQLSTSNVTAAKTAAGMTDANIEAANAADTAGAAHAGFYRELVILGHEAVSGNFARIPGSLLVLAERSGNLDTIFQKVTNTFTSFGGLATIAGVAGVAALGALAVSADNAAGRMIALQDAFRGMHQDYVDFAAEAKTAIGLAVQQTPGLSTADATEAAKSIGNAPDFSGTAQQFANLIHLSADLAASFSETVPKAAADLTAALENPGDAAEKLVGHVSGMTQALADNIKYMADAGDKAGAFAQYEGILSAAVDGATGKLTPLQQGLRAIETAFNDSADAGKGFGEGVGTAIDNAVSYALKGIAQVLAGLKSIHDWDAQYLPWARGYGQAPGGTTPTGVPAANGSDVGIGAVGAMINQVGGSMNLDPALEQLMQRIAVAESSTGQYNSSRALQVSSTGAIGAMQVEPMNANGNDLTTLQGNVTASAQLLIHLWNKYGGDERLVSMAYNIGEGAVDAYLAAGANAQMSPGVGQYILKTAGNTRDGSNATGAMASDTSAQAAASVNGVTNNATDQVNQALKSADGSLAAQSSKLNAEIALLQTGMANLAATGQTGTDAWNKMATQLAATTLQASNLQDPFGKLTLQLNDQTTAQDALANAYGQGYDAVRQTTAYTQALSETEQTVGAKSSFYGQALADLTQKHLALAQATANTQIAQQTLANGDQLEYLKAETDSLGQDTAARDAMLARLKAEQELRKDGISDLSAEGQAYLASVDAISAQTSALQKNQQTISDLENMATQAFDQVGSAITNAFASGGKSALDFGNLARTVFASILSEVAKLAILNPVMNSLFGGSRTTFGDVTTLLGLGGGTGGLGTGVAAAGTTDIFAGAGVADGDSISFPATGGASAGGLLGGGGGLSSILSLGGLLWGNGGVGNALGLSGGIGGELGLTGPDGLLNTPLWGGDGSDLGVFGDASTGAGASLGSLLGGAGAGFGAGSLLNSLLGGNTIGGEAGSGLGGLAGAAIGSIIPGVGTIIGGIVGGLLGGGLGGLFGNQHPSDKTEGYNENILTSNGYVTGNQPGDAEYSSANSSAAKALASTITGGIQAIAQAFDITSGGGLGGTGGLVQTKVGVNGINAELSGKGQTVTSGADSTAGADAVTNGTIKSWINDVSSDFDATTQSLLKEIDFTSQSASAQITALAGAVTNGKLDATQLQALPNINTKDESSAVSDLAWIKNTYEPTVNSDADQGSIVTQTDAINTSFTSLIATATRLGLATDVLTTAQNKQIAAVQAAAKQTIDASGASITAAWQKEQGNTLGSDLTTFDQAGAVQQQQLVNEFQGLFGDSYTTQKDYTTQVALLTQTLAQQRSDLIASWQEQQQATSDSVGAGWVSNITAGIKAQATIASYSNNLATVQWGQQLDEYADLQNFDAQAKTQTDSYSQQLIATYGQSYTTTATYAQQMADLESSLAEQRLAIQAQYAEQAKQMQESAEASAAGVLNNLASYVNSLQTGSASPLNAQSQYGLAQSQFDAEAQLAEGGNVQALQEIQNYAQTFLAASSNLYGSGAQYASDYAEVLQVLQAIASIPQDTLTTAFMTAALQDQTDALLDSQQNLLTALQAIQLELQQQNAR